MSDYYEYYHNNPHELPEMDADEYEELLHEEIVDVCNAILKELNNRAWELKSFIDWERFIQGV